MFSNYGDIAKQIVFYRDQNNLSNKCNQLLILIKMKCKQKYIRCKYNLIDFKCSQERWLYYFCLKLGTKLFGINNRDTTLLHISDIIGGSVI